MYWQFLCFKSLLSLLSELKICTCLTILQATQLRHGASTWLIRPAQDVTDVPGVEWLLVRGIASTALFWSGTHTIRHWTKTTLDDHRTLTLSLAINLRNWRPNRQRITAAVETI